MTELLHAAERARELLAADLQNLQKAAGTAADLKAQATEAEKVLSEASAARASAQNELADLTKQINDAKLVISGTQEETSAKARDLQAVDTRLKEESDRLAGISHRIRRFRPSRPACRDRSRPSALRSRMPRARPPARPEAGRERAESDQLGDGGTERASEPDSSREISGSPRSDGGMDGFAPEDSCPQAHCAPTQARYRWKRARVTGSSAREGQGTWTILA